MQDIMVRVRMGSLCLALTAVLTAGCSTERPPFADLPDAPAAGGDNSGTPAVSQQPSGASPSPMGTNAEAVRSPAAGNGAVGDLSNEAIRTGEMLNISFSDTPQALPAMVQKVRDDGTVTLMFDKSFHAAGMTPGDFQREIRRVYVPDYYAQLTATVIRVEVTRQFFVDGEVRAPSRQQYNGPITVTQAIAACGGFTDFAKKTAVKLIRANGTSEIINCKKAIPNPKLDREVFPGDKIWVPRTIL